MHLKANAAAGNQDCLIYYPHIIEYGGIERNIVALSNSILSKGYSPVLLCHYDLAGMNRFANGLRIEVLGSGIESTKLQRLHALRQHLREAHSRGIPLFLGDRAGHYGALADIIGAAFHYTDPPSLATSHKPSRSLIREMVARPRAALNKRILRRAVHQAAACITMTRENAVELQRVYGKRFEVIYMGGTPPPNGFCRQTSRPHLKPLILFSISRVNASKNLDWMIDAACAVRAIPNMGEDLDIRIVIAGQGDDKSRIFDYAKLCGVESLVSFPGFLTAAELEDWYGKADMVLVPARQGYGLPVLEALYRDVPVVVNRESRISEILDNRSDVVISEANRRSFAQASAQLAVRLLCGNTDMRSNPALPTEAGWGEEVGKRCQWW